MESDMYIPNYKMDAEIIPNVEKRRRRWIRIICILSFVFMLLISFTSHLVNHIEVQNLKRELKTTKDKANDLIHAKQLDLEMQRKHRHSHKVDGLSEITPRLGAGKRRRRHNSGPTPAFSFKGSSGQQATPGNPIAWTNAGFDNTAFAVMDWIGNGGFKKVRILQTGQYYMEAKIAIEGRDTRDYLGYLRVGLELRKKSGGTLEVIDKTYLTQDHSDFPNQPLDTISVAGLFCLKRNDLIFVAISDNIPISPHFKTGPEHARFDAYMVNSSNNFCE